MAALGILILAWVAAGLLIVALAWLRPPGSVETAVIAAAAAMLYILTRLRSR